MAVQTLVIHLDNERRIDSEILQHLEHLKRNPESPYFGLPPETIMKQIFVNHISPQPSKSED